MYSAVFHTPGKVATHKIAQYAASEAEAKPTYHWVALVLYPDEQGATINVFCIKRVFCRVGVPTGPGSTGIYESNHLEIIQEIGFYRPIVQVFE